MTINLRGAIAILLLILLLVSCQDEVQPAPPATTAAGATVVAVQAMSTQETELDPSPTATWTPPPTPTNTPSVTPTLTPSPTSTATPVPQAIQLTSGGCCTQPFWAPDSRQVRYIDRPSAASPAGIYGIAIDQPLSEPVLVTERLEESLTTSDYLVIRQGNVTTIEQLSTGERWRVPANGEDVDIAPGETRIAWSVSDENVPVERRVATIWVADLDGANARRITTLPRGGLSGWISDDVLLISGREGPQSDIQVILAYSLVTGEMVELTRGERLRGQSVSPNGEWLVYYRTFAPDPGENGLWLVRTDGSERRQIDRTLFGAYQWRGCPQDCASADQRLLIIPFQPDAEFHQIWELNATTGNTRQLTDPDKTPFKVSNGDWQGSPDGGYISYVESRDRNIWILPLPE